MTYIQNMFDFLAPRYDLFNRLASFFLDRYWRKFAASLADGSENILDVCTGTGEFAFKLANRTRGRKVTGIDFSPEMLKIAKNKLNGENIEFLWGKAEELPFPHDFFDCVTSGFAMRNVTNPPWRIDVVLKEMHRVLKSEGKIIILEMGKPYSKLLRQLYYIYLRTVLYWVGLITFGKKWPFRYLIYSIVHFLEPEQLKKKLENIGFKDVQYSPLTGGIVGVYIGVKYDAKIESLGKSS